MGHMGDPSNQLSQTGFRGRYDDGVESLQESDGGATWIADLNTDWSQMPDITFRMRILVDHQNTATTFDDLLSMSFSHNGGEYIKIGGFSGSPVVDLVDTTFWVNGDNSTDFIGRLGTGNWDDTENLALQDDGLGIFHFLGPAGTQKEVETEWSLQIKGVDVSPGDTIDFRCFGFTTGALFSRGYIFTPRLTVLDPESDAQMSGTPVVDPAVEGERDVQPAQTLESKVTTILSTESETTTALGSKSEAATALNTESETTTALSSKSGATSTLSTKAEVTAALIAKVDI